MEDQALRGCPTFHEGLNLLDAQKTELNPYQLEAEITATWTQEKEGWSFLLPNHSWP